LTQIQYPLPAFAGTLTTSEDLSAIRMSSPAGKHTRTAVSPSSSSAGWWMTGVFCFAGMISYIDRLILSVLVDPIRQEMLISDYQVSLLQGAAFAVIYVLAGLPLGRLADRHHRLSILLTGSTMWCAGGAYGPSHLRWRSPAVWQRFRTSSLISTEASEFPWLPSATRCSDLGLAQALSRCSPSECLPILGLSVTP
jgi:MFS family permease